MTSKIHLVDHKLWTLSSLQWEGGRGQRTRPQLQGEHLINYCNSAETINTDFSSLAKTDIIMCKTPEKVLLCFPANDKHGYTVYIYIYIYISLQT